ncbi:MAG TPA: hypothetical protein VIK89_05025 [Cytophagaceae bacterium]
MLTKLKFETFHLFHREEVNNKRSGLYPIYTRRFYKFDKNDQRVVQRIVKLYKATSAQNDHVAGYFDIKKAAEFNDRSQVIDKNLLNEFVWYLN